MATLDDVMALLYAIKADVAALKGAGGGAPAASSSGGATDTFPFDKLTAAWADKSVGRVPKNWSGRDIVGLMYSELSSEEATSLAGTFQWKGENPVIDKVTGQPKKSGKGKPWADSDKFEAKLLRTWAAYAKSRPAAKPKATGGPDDFGAPEEDSSEIPFLLCRDVPARLTRTPRWEKW